MRLALIVVATFAPCMVKPWVSAAAPDTSATRPTAYLPPCATECLAVVIPQSACTATDLDCICNNQALTDSTTACLVSNCTVKEALSTAKYQKDTCNAPVRDQTDLIAKVNYPLQFIATFTVLFRVFARSQRGQGAGFWWDDWFLLLGFCLFTAGTGVTLRMGAIGLGKDMWEVPYDNITQILLHFFNDEVLYIGVLSATKMSIIFLHLRIFPAVISHAFRWWCIGFIALTAAYWVSLSLTVITACSPVSYSWNRWDPSEHSGHCIDVNAGVFSAAGINIALDFAILLLPVPKLLKLEVSWPMKIVILATFSMGTFSIICSIIRLKSLIEWGHTTNPTWDYNTIAVWSTIEGASTVICANMPQMAGPIQSSTTKTSGSHVLELSHGQSHGALENGIQKTMSVTAFSQGRAQSTRSDENLVRTIEYRAYKAQTRGSRRPANADWAKMASNAGTFAQPSPESTDLSELEKARQGSGNDHDHDDDSASTASDSTFSERHMEGPQSLRGVPTTLSRTTSRRLEQTGTATSTALSRIRSRPARRSFTHPLANEKTNQDVLVDFDGPDDPYRPLNWPFGKKAITTVLYGFTTMGATFASTLLLFGFGLGPLVWAPLSEVYGRKPAVLIPTFISAIFAFGGGAAKDIQTILICRFFQGLFGSAPVTNTGGVLGDIWSAEQRGAAIVGYAMAVVGGPTLGPIVGGAICMSYLRWRWTQYITGIFQMFILVLDIIVLDESYPAALLVSKAQRLRHQTGNWALHAKHEEWDVSLNELANKYLVRPFQLLMTPICFLVALYASFVYGILYASLAAFPIEFEEARGWNKVVGALPFLAMLLGVIIGAGANLFNQKFYIKRWRANNCRPVPEARLPPMMAGSLFFVAGLFMFAWTSSPSIHWIAPCIGIVLLGCGFFTIF
ncbi:MFS general substrate transporter, partial [Hortaea werneckii]